MRRRFDEAVKALPKASQKMSLAYLALKQIQAIYREENKLSDMEPDERLKHRQLTVKPLVDAYFAWIKQNINKVPTKGKTHSGFTYSLKRNMEYIIEEPKTSCGTRKIPMSEYVYECFGRIIANRKKVKSEPMIDGKCVFLYLDKNNMPMVALHWEKYFQHICQKYNRIYKIQMPKITPHVCRHTYCSNMAKSGMNPKTLQYLIYAREIKNQKDENPLKIKEIRRK